MVSEFAIFADKLFVFLKHKNKVACFVSVLLSAHMERFSAFRMLNFSLSAQCRQTVLFNNGGQTVAFHTRGKTVTFHTVGRTVKFNKGGQTVVFQTGVKTVVFHTDGQHKHTAAWWAHIRTLHTEGQVVVIDTGGETKL